MSECLSLLIATAEFNDAEEDDDVRHIRTSSFNALGSILIGRNRLAEFLGDGVEICTTGMPRASTKA